jgi:alkanesulfonate monooxygenase SsuD/methylene tetrahydromethanopterin reductase-like flavin-dependent oxidoreductase (luciferase family)
MQFGLFDHLDLKPEAPARTLADRIAFIRAAEAGGFRSYHLAEHHGTPLGMASSPSVFLAAVAQATTRIRLGPLVYLLPLYDPLRLIGEICLLDQLSNGRLEVGVGRAISPIELNFYGVGDDIAVARTAEALAVLRAGLYSERLTFKGRFFNYDDVPLPLAPLQKPLPFWSASMSSDGLTEAARAGMNTAALGNVEMIRVAVQTYREASLRLKDDPMRQQFGVAEPLNGMYRMVLVAPTDAEAERLARPSYLNWFGKLIKLWRERGIEAPLIGALDNFETARAVGMLVCGSPARVADELAAQIDATGVNYVMAQMAYGDLAHRDEMASLDLFVEKVMPSFAT